MAVWDPFLTARDREVFAGTGHGRAAGFGKRPVVMVIDMNYFFCGDRREPILESIKRWRNSCGEEAWDAAERIAELLAVAHRQGIPVIYSTGVERRPDGWGRGRWGDKNSRKDPAAVEEAARANTILPPIAPIAEDIVIRKAKPSVFFGTLLSSYLVDLQADTIIATGGVTSGCVRSTVVDGFSHNYRMAVVEDGVFDRGQATHALNLFDLQQKYADVISLAQACDYLSSLPAGLFDEQMPALRAMREQRDASR
jgi:nicotinamidase-related amidase